MTEVRIETVACRLCGTTANLTKHHLLKRESARLVGTNRQVVLCRPCHDRFHRGLPKARAQAWDELRAVLTPDEVALLDDPRRIPELWETKL